MSNKINKPSSIVFSHGPYRCYKCIPWKSRFFKYQIYVSFKSNRHEPCLVNMPYQTPSTWVPFFQRNRLLFHPAVPLLLVDLIENGNILSCGNGEENNHQKETTPQIPLCFDGICQWDEDNLRNMSVFTPLWLPFFFLIFFPAQRGCKQPLSMLDLGNQGSKTTTLASCYKTPPSGGFYPEKKC